MDVAFYAPLKPPDHPVASGDRRMARLLLAALERSGRQPALISHFRSYDGGGDQSRQQRIEALGTRIAARLIDSWSKPGASPPKAWFTYHLYHKAPDWLGPAVCGRLRIPYYVAEASYAPKRAGGPWDRGHRATAEALGKAARVFCLNANDVPCIRPLLTGPDRVVMLPPFLDTAPFREAAHSRPSLRGVLAERFDLDPGTPWLLAVGMMRRGDKLASYRSLARSLRMVGPHRWQLIVVGDGPARTAVETAFEAFAPNRVRFAGMTDETALPSFYAAADVLAWPAVNEAYGMALLEAQAVGLPVISARTGGVPGIVDDGRTGFLVEPRDEVAFARALARLLDDASLRERCRAAALEKTASGHDIATAARTLAREMTA